MTLSIVFLELDVANGVVRAVHRHHAPVQGHRFSVGAVSDGVLVGAAIAGRPVAKVYDPTAILEVTRCATDGTRNACSLLYGACARAAKAMGFERVQTYTLDIEQGASLRAAGFVLVGTTPGRQWVHTDPPTPRRTDQPTTDKSRWERVLREPVKYDDPHAVPSPQEPLF